MSAPPLREKPVASHETVALRAEDAAEPSTALRVAVGYFGVLHLHALLFALVGPMMRPYVGGIVVTQDGLQPAGTAAPHAVVWTVAPFVIAFGYAWGATLLSKARRVGIHEGAELLRPASEDQEDIRNEAGLLLHRENALAEVVREGVQLRYREAADRMGSHGSFQSPTWVVELLRRVPDRLRNGME